MQKQTKRLMDEKWDSISAHAEEGAKKKCRTEASEKMEEKQNQHN